MSSNANAPGTSGTNSAIQTPRDASTIAGARMIAAITKVHHRGRTVTRSR